MLFGRHCRRTRDPFTRRDIPHHPGLGGDLGSAADLEMAGYSGLTTDHDKISYFRAPGYTCLRSDNTTPANTYIMGYLHQIIYPGSFADNSIRSRAPIDGCIGANLAIILYDHSAKLRHFDKACGIRGKTKSILPNSRAGMQCHPVADQRMTDGNKWPDPRFASDHDVFANHRIGANMRTGSNLRPCANNGAWRNLHVRTKLGGRVDACASPNF